MSQSDEFKPIPYSFALVDIFNKPLIIKKSILASCPPFHILLDHTIAVIWVLFSLKYNDPVTLGSGQISWALRFLEGMANEIQCCGVDIKKAIECLQCALINCISQEHSVKVYREEKNESGTEITKTKANYDLINQESFDSIQNGDILKSILLKDMLKR